MSIYRYLSLSLYIYIYIYVITTSHECPANVEHRAVMQTAVGDTLRSANRACKCPDRRSRAAARHYIIV